MPCFYATPKQDDFNQTPELQVCIADALQLSSVTLNFPSVVARTFIVPLQPVP